MTAPMTSREELPSEASLKFANELDDEMRAGLGIGELALRLEKFAAGFRAPAQGPSTLPKGVSVSAACKAIGFCEWLSGYIGHGPAVKISSDQMDYIRSKVHPLMVDLGVVVRPPSPIPSTGLPAPAPHAEVRESDLYKLRDLIASHFACEDDCQKYPSGCGCALTAARAVQELGGK